LQSSGAAGDRDPGPRLQGTCRRKARALKRDGHGRPCASLRGESFVKDAREARQDRNRYR